MFTPHASASAIIVYKEHPGCRQVKNVSSTLFDYLYKNSIRVSFDNTSKLVFFSDIHRGDGSPADSFKHNSGILYHALKYYFDGGFTCIELGDGDELWKNTRFPDIFDAHRDIFMLLSEFHREKRLHMLYGNHDIAKKSESFVKSNLHKCLDFRSGERLSLFEGISVHEGIVFAHEGSRNEILAIHGHQADFMNYNLWISGMLFSRYILRNIELLGMKGLLDLPLDSLRTILVENRLAEWARSRHTAVIAGHTHRPAFAALGGVPYFNAGSCVYPSFITCIEIQDSEISLVKWGLKENNGQETGAYKKLFLGPQRIDDNFSNGLKL